jgi:hypothetical protein
MNVLPSPRTAMADDYLSETAEAMMRLFNISEDEAIGRIAQEFGHWDLGDDEECWMLGHEEPEYWAHWTYYGDILWWLMEPQELTPQPYPLAA